MQRFVPLKAQHNPESPKKGSLSIDNQEIDFLREQEERRQKSKWGDDDENSWDLYGFPKAKPALPSKTQSQPMSSARIKTALRSLPLTPPNTPTLEMQIDLNVLGKPILSETEASINTSNSKIAELETIASSRDDNDGVFLLDEEIEENEAALFCSELRNYRG